MKANKQIIQERSGSKLALWFSVCLFLVLDCSILGINYYITAQLERDAQIINIAGRQRMLSQRLAKNLLMVRDDLANQEVHIEELDHVFSLFETTLSAFSEGGRVVGGSGESFYLEAINDQQVDKLVEETYILLTPLALPVEAILEGNLGVTNLNNAISAIQRYNLAILKLMNSLTSRVEALSKQKTRNLRQLQTFAFVLAIINFLIIIGLYHRRSKLAEGQVDSFLSLVDSAAASLIVMDADRRIILANQLSQELFGYDAHVFAQLDPNDLFRESGEECFAVRRDGSSFRAEISERSLDIHERTFIILTVSDISPYTDAQEHLAYLANHDALTGLVNRRALFDRLDLEILHARRSGTLMGVFFLDLNGFKPVNDQFGHAVGDELLKLLAKRLVGAMRDTDTVARYGGDEFVIVSTDINHRNQVGHCAEKINAVFEQSFVYEDIEMILGCSAGLSVYPDDGESAGELIDCADKRMYENKQLHKLG